MRYGKIAGLDTPISRLVIGTMVCTTDDLGLTFELLDAWLAEGGNCLDTARVYGGGKTELAIGEWFAARGNRERVVLLGKGAHPDSSGPRVNPTAIAEDIAESLRRMQTDTMDIYLLHRDDLSVPVGPIVECLNEHKAAGRIRAFGGSNWTAARIQEANDYATAHGLQGFSASSPYFGLAAQNEPMWGGCLSLTAEDKAWHEAHQFPLFPWSSQASGFFTGRYEKGDGQTGDVPRVYYSNANFERLLRARELADAKGCTPNNIALAYVLHQPFPVFPLIGPRTVAELHSSLPALDITLTETDLRYLDI